MSVVFSIPYTAAKDPNTQHALDFLLQTITAIEDQQGHAAHRLTARIQDRVARALSYEHAHELLRDLYRHARWVAFQLDGALSAADGSELSSSSRSPRSSSSSSPTPQEERKETAIRNLSV